MSEKNTSEENISTSKLGLISLTLTFEADQDGVYCSAIDEALENKNHYNIALTGGYGTGKSSVIETYIYKKDKTEKEKIIRVSLANFNFRNEEKPRTRFFISGKTTNENEEQVALEISILQQIIFQIRKKAVYSKFRKTIRINPFTPIWFSLIIISTAMSTFVFWNPFVLLKFGFQSSMWELIYSQWFLYINFFISIAGLITILSYLIYSFLSYKIIKFDVKNFGVNFEKKDIHFKLNSQIDELIYLLKKSMTKMVIFEDLDRFENYEIFEKLREINHILKYSPDLRDQKVRFIYVLRESIFKNENEKNKFFDIIIPIVPFISTNNAEGKLLSLFSSEIETASRKDDFKGILKTTALCIDEMRTIVSIYNDYKVYLRVISNNESLPKHELLALIIYKNLFPLDFEEINKGTSMLEQILNLRQDYIKEALKTINEDLKTKKEKIKELSEEPHDSINDLRMEYINTIIRMGIINQTNITRVNNLSNVRVDDLIKKDNFSKIIKNGVTHNNRSISFEEIQNTTNPHKSYEDRISLIEQRAKNKKVELEFQIKQKEKKIKKLENETLSNIIKHLENEIELYEKVAQMLPLEIKSKNEENPEKSLRNGSENIKYDLKIKLITSFLIDGYISQNFTQYISVFHEGALSNNDRKLYMSFKSGKALDFDQTIESPQAFLEQFTPSDWNKSSFLCNSLVDCMLNSDNFKEKLDLLFLNADENTLKFIEAYISKSLSKKHLEKLSNHLFPNWVSFSEQAISLKNIEIDVYDKILPYLLLNQEFKIIQEHNKNNILSTYISEKSKINNILEDELIKSQYHKERLAHSLKDLNVRFYLLADEDKSIVLDIIYQNNLYEININMINLWGRIFSEEDLKYPNYSNIMNSSLEELKGYINSNINEFIRIISFTLKKDNNKWHEEEEWIKVLLNNSLVDKKEYIISEVDYFEFHLNDVDSGLWKEIVYSKKMKCTWENIVVYYKKFNIDDNLLNFLNTEKLTDSIDVYGKLSKKTLPFSELEKFWESLLEQEINETSLKNLNQNFPYYIPINIISAVTNKSNLELLISLKVFNPEVVLDAFDQIQTHFRNEMLHLKFALKYEIQILLNPSNSNLFSSINQKEELLFIAKNNFSKTFFQKSFTINKGLDKIQLNKEEALGIMRKIQKYKFLELEELLVSVFRYLSEHKQPEFFVWLTENGIITKNELYKYLSLFKGSLQDIQKPLKGFKIDNNKINRSLADSLKTLNIINQYKIEKRTRSIRFKRNSFKDFIK